MFDSEEISPISAMLEILSRGKGAMEAITTKYENLNDDDVSSVDLSDVMDPDLTRDEFEECLDVRCAETWDELSDGEFEEADAKNASSPSISRLPEVVEDENDSDSGEVLLDCGEPGCKFCEGINRLMLMNMIRFGLRVVKVENTGQSHLVQDPYLARGAVVNVTDCWDTLTKKQRRNALKDGGLENGVPSSAKITVMLTRFSDKNMIETRSETAAVQRISPASSNEPSEDSEEDGEETPIDPKTDFSVAVEKNRVTPACPLDDAFEDDFDDGQVSKTDPESDVLPSTSTHGPSNVPDLAPYEDTPAMFGMDPKSFLLFQRAYAEVHPENPYGYREIFTRTSQMKKFMQTEESRKLKAEALKNEVLSPPEAKPRPMLRVTNVESHRPTSSSVSCSQDDDAKVRRKKKKTRWGVSFDEEDEEWDEEDDNSKKKNEKKKSVEEQKLDEASSPEKRRSSEVRGNLYEVETFVENPPFLSRVSPVKPTPRKSEFAEGLEVGEANKENRVERPLKSILKVRTSTPVSVEVKKRKPTYNDDDWDDEYTISRFSFSSSSKQTGVLSSASNSFKKPRLSRRPEADDGFDMSVFPRLSGSFIPT